MLLLDEKASRFVRTLMREVPVRDENGNILEYHPSANYSQIIAQFLARPTNIVNNRDLKMMEQSLALTLDYHVKANEPHLPIINEINEDDIKISMSNLRNPDELSSYKSVIEFEERPNDQKPANV